jgi:predicted HicB family RNase H-like nuclease
MLSSAVMRRAQSMTDKPKRKTTSFRLDPELVRRAQHYAIDHHLSLQAMVEQGLRLLMKEGRK